MKSFLFTFFSFFLITFFLNAQSSDSPVLAVRVSYAYQLSSGDLSNRFGNNFNAGAGLERLSSSNWIYGLEGQFLFGSQVKEDVLFNLRTDEGYIISTNRSVAFIELRQRGWYLGGLIGKLFSFTENSRTGLRATLGLGVLQHKIRIQDDPEATVAQLTSDYKKGYDRLSNGLALHPTIGYQYMSKDGRTNLYIGIEYMHAFTQNRRSYNFDTMQAEDTTRNDGLLGVRATWVIPIYSGDGEEIIY